MGLFDRAAVCSCNDSMSPLNLTIDFTRLFIVNSCKKDHPNNKNKPDKSFKMPVDTRLKFMEYKFRNYNIKIDFIVFCS